MQKTHFIFDLDDTLTDSYDFNQQMFVDTFAGLVDISKPEVDKYLRDLHYNNRGRSMVLQFEEVVNHFNLSAKAHELTKINENLHIENVDKIGIFDAVKEIIVSIKDKNKKVSVCTNRQTESLMRILKNHKMDVYFENIISCADAGHEKPDPFCLKEIIAKSGEPKDNFIYFGDSRTDSQFATNAGVDFVIIDHYLNQKKFYKMIIQSFM